jgi:hypothetical protein
LQQVNRAFDLHRLGVLLFTLLEDTDPFVEPPGRAAGTKKWSEYLERMQKGFDSLRYDRGRRGKHFYIGWYEEDGVVRKAGMDWSHTTEAFNFVRRLLSPYSEVRLGAYEGHETDPFFEKVNWDEVRGKEVWRSNCYGTTVP